MLFFHFDFSFFSLNIHFVFLGFPPFSPIRQMKNRNSLKFLKKINFTDTAFSAFLT